MPTTKDINEFISTLSTAQMRVIADLNAEELEYLCNSANNRYEESFKDVQSDKLRLLSTPLIESTKREDRTISKLTKFFDCFNIFAKMTDKEIGLFAQDNLWVSQSPFSNETALLENMIDRLLRSENVALPKVITEDDTKV